MSSVVAEPTDGIVRRVGVLFELLGGGILGWLKLNRSRLSHRGNSSLYRPCIGASVRAIDFV